METRTRTEDKLLELGITPNLGGFYCICEAVELIRKEPRTKTVEIYKKVGEKLGIGADSVDRRIRVAASKADKNLIGLGNRKEIKNSEFLFTLYVILRREHE